MRPNASGSRYAGRSSATRSRSTVIPLVQPIRSATTVAAISGVTANNRRIAGSNPSTADPGPSRTYFGATSARNAARTVFRATPRCRAIALTAIPSRPVQPPDLCPLLHVDHFPSPVPAIDGRAQAQVRTTPSGGPDREGSIFDR